jgi:hypothetical protein
MAEHDRLARAPVLEKDLDAVFGGDGGHEWLLLTFESFRGAHQREPGIWKLSREIPGAQLRTMAHRCAMPRNDEGSAIRQTPSA